MNKPLCCALAALSLYTLPPVLAHAADAEQTDRFMDCLSIAEDQRERDPDEAMKKHWAQFSEIYASNVFYFSGSIQYAFDHIQEKFNKWDNMRNFIAAAAVNNLALAVLKKCDEEAVAHLDRVDPYRVALDGFLKEREAAKKTQ